MGSQKVFYSVPEIAKIMGVSRIAIYNKVKQGQIKAQKVGRNYIVSKDALGFLFNGEISEEDKAVIDAGVKKTVSEYGDVLKKLGEE